MWSSCLSFLVLQLRNALQILFRANGDIEWKVHHPIAVAGLINLKTKLVLEYWESLDLALMNLIT